MGWAFVLGGTLFGTGVLTGVAIVKSTMSDFFEMGDGSTD